MVSNSHRSDRSRSEDLLLAILPVYYLMTHAHSSNGQSSQMTNTCKILIVILNLIIVTLGTSAYREKLEYFSVPFHKFSRLRDTLDPIDWFELNCVCSCKFFQKIPKTLRISYMRGTTNTFLIKSNETTYTETSLQCSKIIFLINPCKTIYFFQNEGIFVKLDE